MKNRLIRKAVFPVGGLGTRFLPATKSLPKEMLPIVDRPLIQYAVEEALDAGIEQIVFVTGRGKQAIEDHFDVAYELESTMQSRGKSLELLDGTRFAPGRVAYVRQQEPLGLGHAVWCARHFIGSEPFAVLLADDFMVGAPGCLRQMVDAYADLGGNLICAQNIPQDQTEKYGIIVPGAMNGDLTEVRGLVEKPARGSAPSTLAVIGRYILQPEVMEALSTQNKGAGGEIQLTDAMARTIGKQPFNSLTFRGHRYDCGDKAGYIKANIAMALTRTDIGAEVDDFIVGLNSERLTPVPSAAAR